MHLVELYSKDDCHLCDGVKKTLAELKEKNEFELREIHLTEDHPRASEFLPLVPVVIIDGEHRLHGRISRKELLRILSIVPHPNIQFFVAKFFEALGMLTVFFGFIYGLLGNMWTDLYFFLGGLAIFGVGWTLERRARKTMSQPKPPA